jgi:polysaccharide pyruvyl transferase WcaK-like protein
LINKPVLALSYHPKIDVLMADTGQSDYCLPIGDFDIDALKDRFTSLVLNCETVKDQLAKRTREYRAALEEQYDHIFGSV